MKFKDITIRTTEMRPNYYIYKKIKVSPPVGGGDLEGAYA
jgi:hypothetical protein